MVNTEYFDWGGRAGCGGGGWGVRRGEERGNEGGLYLISSLLLFFLFYYRFGFLFLCPGKYLNMEGLEREELKNEI